MLPDRWNPLYRLELQTSLNAPTGAWCSLTTVSSVLGLIMKLSQCTYRCVVLPDSRTTMTSSTSSSTSQCTYRCVVPPDVIPTATMPPLMSQCTYSSLTIRGRGRLPAVDRSQCTYRCVVLPDLPPSLDPTTTSMLSQCTYRCVVLPDFGWWTASCKTNVSQCTYRCVVLPDCMQRSCCWNRPAGLNAPTGAWCSLTRKVDAPQAYLGSQCTYRCVVLPDTA